MKKRSRLLSSGPLNLLEDVSSVRRRIQKLTIDVERRDTLIKSLKQALATKTQHNVELQGLVMGKNSESEIATISELATEEKEEHSNADVVCLLTESLQELTTITCNLIEFAKLQKQWLGNHDADQV